ncbi:MAG: hypothetical protein RLZZ04_4416 [Cyanobacteriota bacterium]|jgi:hypothetical protein
MRDFGECERVREDAKIVITDPGSGNNRSKFRLENPNKLKIREVKPAFRCLESGINN